MLCVQANLHQQNGKDLTQNVCLIKNVETTHLLFYGLQWDIPRMVSIPQPQKREEQNSRRWLFYEQDINSGDTISKPHLTCIINTKHLSTVVTELWDSYSQSESLNNRQSKLNTGVHILKQQQCLAWFDCFSTIIYTKSSAIERWPAFKVIVRVTDSETVPKWNVIGMKKQVRKNFILQVHEVSNCLFLP